MCDKVEREATTAANNEKKLLRRIRVYLSEEWVNLTELIACNNRRLADIINKFQQNGCNFFP